MLDDSAASQDGWPCRRPRPLATIEVEMVDLEGVAMLRHLVVPVDGSRASFDALPVAVRFAKEVDGHVTVIGVHDVDDVSLVRHTVEDEIARLGTPALGSCRFVLSNEHPADVIVDIVSSTPDALVVMSSHGRGRSAAVLGSTTNEVLRAIGGPLVAVGPNCDTEHVGPLDGPFVVPLDGSERAERILPVAAAWSLQLGGTPWLVRCVPAPSASICRARYLSPLAREVRRSTDAAVQYEVLEDEHAARPIVEFALVTHAPLIFMSTHGRTGLARLRSGSVAAEVLRKAPCPVVLMRPQDLEPESDAPGHIAVTTNATTVSSSDEVLTEPALS
jgi:nucleotide-binding universal stress UspA family protein